MLKNESFGGVKSEETTIISNGVKIEGKISSSGNIRVDGEVLGDIISQSNVSIGESGQVNGQINANVITIGGKVSGTVKAKEKLVLDSKGNLKGDIFTKILVVEAGAKFDGKSKMGDLKEIVEVKEPVKPDNITTNQ
jgi:cytoskeletal protein CcmA (bactofilin family)